MAWTCGRSVAQAASQVRVRVDAAVTEKRPDSAELALLHQVAIGEKHFLFVDGGPGDNFTVGVGDETLAPELGPALGADPIGRGDIATIGDAVTTLDGFPGVMLSLAECGLFFGQPADRCWVEENLSTTERGEAGGFRVPLVPADQDADIAVGRLPGAEAEITWREVEFLLKPGVLRDVHLAVLTEHGAIGVDDGSSVVVDFAAARFEEWRDNDDAEPLRDLGEFGDRRTRLDGLSEVEVLRVLIDAEILRREHLLQADDFGALRRCLFNTRNRPPDIGRRGILGGELDETDADGVSHGAGRQ